MKLPTEKSKIIKDINQYIWQLYGDPKAGKSTFASHFPNAIFIATEPGLKFLEVYGGDHVHKDWQDIKETCFQLMTTKHQFKTVVIDTVDIAWDYCREYVQKKLNVRHESEDKGYGRSWDMVKTEFRNTIRNLVNSDMGVVFISHSEMGTRSDKGIERPFMDNTLAKGARKFVNGLCDFIFYCTTDSQGNRMMITKPQANLNAGDRLGVFPERMELDFNKFMEHFNQWNHNHQ